MRPPLPVNSAAALLELLQSQLAHLLERLLGFIAKGEDGALVEGALDAQHSAYVSISHNKAHRSAYVTRRRACSGRAGRTTKRIRQHTSQARRLYLSLWLCVQRYTYRQARRLYLALLLCVERVVLQVLVDVRGGR
jgi:hypothetical protein